jgi:glyoxylase-like metal-dependent hydrolase (beta-lactamase superfamily II)
VPTSPVAVGITGNRPDPDRGRAIRLAPGLWQVAGPGITHPWDGGAYLVTAGHRPALIDCGTGLGDLDAVLAGLGVVPRDLAVVIATHGHFDHIGDGARLGARGVPVLVHPGDAAAVASGDPVRTCAASLYGAPFSPFAPLECGDGDRFDLGAGVALELVHTPGHTPGSLCVVVELFGLRVLLAGDTLWGGFSPSIGSDEVAWRSSLARLAALDVDALTFGHAPTRLLDEPLARIAEAQARFATYFDPWFKPPKLQFRFG